MNTYHIATKDDLLPSDAAKMVIEICLGERTRIDLLDDLQRINLDRTCPLGHIYCVGERFSNLPVHHLWASPHRILARGPSLV